MVEGSSQERLNMFLIFMIPAMVSLLIGLVICRSGSRGVCAKLWALSLVTSNISAYLAAPPYAPRIWLTLAIGSPLICIGFAIATRFASSDRIEETDASNLGKARRWAIVTMALGLLPISCIIITMVHMANFEANTADCKRALASKLLADTAKSQEETRLKCSALVGFSSPDVYTDSVVYTGTLVGQQVFLTAVKVGGEAKWKCNVYPKIFGSKTCEGYEVGWH